MGKMIVVAVLSAFLSAGAWAQAPSAAPPEMKSTGTGKAEATRTVKVTAVVTAVDAANRTVTLKGKDGKTQTFKVGPDVQRFGEVAVGDTLVAEYKEGLALEFQPPGTPAVAPEGAAVAGRAGKDQAPGGVAAAEVRATVTVTAIDAKNRMVVFQGPAGNLYQVKAGPKIQLEKLKVGDQLLATYVEAVAITLEKPGKK
jgi:hypothetical protein